MLVLVLVLVLESSIVIYRQSVECWWGGANETFDGLAAFALAFSGKGAGTIWIAGAGLGAPGRPATFPPAGPRLDPDRNLPGFGFRQRRARRMLPEEPLVLEWLKRLQDLSSPERALLPSTPGENLDPA